MKNKSGRISQDELNYSYATLENK